MYIVDWSTTKSNICLIAKGNVDLCQEWHKRLSHLNFKTMNKLARRQLVKGLPSLVYSKDKICNTCQRGKQIKSSFKTKPFESSTRPLSLLHMDMFGPINMSERKYTLVIIDDYFRFTWTIFMKQKNEIKRKLPKLMKMLQNEKSMNIIKIQSYRGREFMNQVIKGFCYVIVFNTNSQLLEHLNTQGSRSNNDNRSRLAKRVLG